MRTLFWSLLSLGLCGWLAAAHADTYQLRDGQSLSGHIILFTSVGVTLRMSGDTYTNLVWPMFSQATLKRLSAQNPKIKPLAGVFIEAPPAAQTKHIAVQQISRLQLPKPEFLLVALLSSSVGFVVLLLLYAANVYAAYEIAIVRARPIVLTMGVAAVLPILGPIIFLAMPMRRQAEPEAEAPAPAEPQTFTTPGQAASEAAAESAEPGKATSGLHIAPATGARHLPEPQVFQRGQFMFNRRFFETKFAGFFPTVRRPAERDLVLLVKTARAQLTVQRITRIASNEVHFEIVEGGAQKETMVPFTDIQEIQIKHKDA